jgi:hypothetical protein
VFRQGIARPLVATLAAWAMLFHVLAMTLMPQPAAALEAGGLPAFDLLCSSASHDNGTAPASPHTSAAMASCALCGLGCSALDVPPVFLVPAPRSIVETRSRALRELPKPVLDRPGRAQPRGPPAFA